MKIDVFMFGSRMHYAVPSIFHSAGLLGKLYNDFNALSLPQWAMPALSKIDSASVQSLLQRMPQGIPNSKNVTCLPIALKLHYRRSRARSFQQTVAAEISANTAFFRHALKNGLGKSGASFTYDRAGLEVMRHVKDQGGIAIMEQTVAPASLLIQLLAAEKPDFGGEEARGWEMLSARERDEWPLADLILCGSSFVRDSIIDDGAPSKKCVVVPYGVQAENYFARIRKFPEDRPIRLLSVGEVGFRKGAAQLIEAARKLENVVEVVFVGTIRGDEIDIAAAPSNVRFVGKVPRNAVRDWYEWADLFVLPSLFEGSATVTYEAMASGLPVICTPQTGSIVEHGRTGLIIPARQNDALVDALKSINRDNYEEWSQTIVTTARRWDATHYGTELLNAAQKVLS